MNTCFLKKVEVWSYNIVFAFCKYIDTNPMFRSSLYTISCEMKFFLYLWIRIRDKIHMNSSLIAFSFQFYTILFKPLHDCFCPWINSFMIGISITMHDRRSKTIKALMRTSNVIIAC